MSGSLEGTLQEPPGTVRGLKVVHAPLTGSTVLWYCGKERKTVDKGNQEGSIQFVTSTAARSPCNAQRIVDPILL